MKNLIQNTSEKETKILVMILVVAWFFCVGDTWFLSDDSLVLKIGLTVADTMLFGGCIATFKFNEKYPKILLFVMILGLILTNLLPKIIN